MVRVAIVQDGPVIYDKARTLDKVEQLTASAAEQDAELVLFPEAFVGGYMKGLDFGIRMGSRSDAGRAEFQRYFENAVEFEGADSDRLAQIAGQHRVHLFVGVVEREGGTLYCSVFFYSPEGQRLGKHRKLLPTALERCVWGQGDGSTAGALQTPLGRLGVAVCWENYMPLLRTSLYQEGVQLYLAPTVDDRDVWLPTMQTIALEGRCFVLSACQFLRALDFPADHPARREGGQGRVLIRGGSCAVSPLGRVLVQPVFGQAALHVLDLDLGEVVRGKFDLDTVGHYARPDVFKLTVNRNKL